MVAQGDRLEGKVCIVTGAAQGIGAEYALRLAREGAAVGVVDLTRMDQANEVTERITNSGGQALAIKGDVTDEDEMTKVVDAVVSKYGRVDCLVNNAGLYQDRAGATWDMFVEVNVLGIVRSSNAVVPHLWQQRSGSIINIGSVAAMLAPTSVMGETVDANGPPPRIDPGGYAMTKWMVIYLTRLMARQLGPRNIRVNTVVPGVTMSVATADAIRAAPAILEKRINDSALRSVVQPEDMTGVVTFLASEDSAKMTGQVLVNDAGMWFSG